MLWICFIVVVANGDQNKPVGSFNQFLASAIERFSQPIQTQNESSSYIFEMDRGQVTDDHHRHIQAELIQKINELQNMNKQVMEQNEGLREE